MFPFSVRPGFEQLRGVIDDQLLAQVREDAVAQRADILEHKLDSLLEECAGYLSVALRSAEVSDSEREQLHLKILGQKETLSDTRLALKLIVRHAAAGIRTRFETLLKADEAPVRRQTACWSSERVSRVDAQSADCHGAI